MELIANIDLGLISLTYAGALCTHILSLYKEGFNGTIEFAKRMFPRKTDTFYFRFDTIVLPIMGALLAFVLLEPSSYKSAIFAGISWSGSLLTLLHKNKRNTEDSDNA